MQFHVRVCQECGEEYRPDIAICADCGGELQDVYEDQGAPVRKTDEEDVEVVDLSGHRTVFQSRHATDLVPMAERLKDQGIDFQLVEEGAPGHSRFGLVVPDANAAATLEALADLIAPHEKADDVHALETSYEAASGRYVRCPACGAEQGSGLTECAECGLALSPAVPTCERCEAPLEEEGASCSVCGGPSPVG